MASHLADLCGDTKLTWSRHGVSPATGRVTYRSYATDCAVPRSPERHQHTWRLPLICVRLSIRGRSGCARWGGPTGPSMGSIPLGDRRGTPAWPTRCGSRFRARFSAWSRSSPS